MKVLIASALLLAHTGLLAAQAPQPHVRLSILRQEAIRTIQAGKTLLPQDPKDPLNGKFLPRLSEIRISARDSDTRKKLDAANAAYEAWKIDVFKELYPEAGVESGAEAAKALENRRSALTAAEHLSGVLTDASDRASLDALRQKVFTASDPQALNRIYENIRTFTPAVVAPPVPVYAAGRYGAGASEVSIRPAAAAARPAVAVTPVPSDYQSVVDYLVKQGASRKMVSMAVGEARRQGADPLMVLSVIQAESFFDPKATSECGAIGLMQIMPDTGRGLGVQNASSLYDPMTNLRAGVRFLKNLWDRFTDVVFTELGSIDPSTNGDVKKAIAAYNAGPGAVKKYGGVPPYRETRNYVVKVLGYYSAMRRQLDS